jgi:hypothetical protein
MTNNLPKRVVVMAAMLFTAASVQAATFEGTTTGVWTNPQGGEGMIVNGVGTSFFEWGATDSSSLLFEGTDFEAEVCTPFLVGNVTYENATSAIGTGATGVDLEVTFAFTLPSIPDEVFTYTFSLVNTVNTDNQADSADIITIPDGVALPIFIDGQAYSLRVWFGDVELGGDGFVDAEGFHVYEGGNATVNLLGHITVPDGGLTIALLGAALGGIGFLNRKMRK